MNHIFNSLKMINSQLHSMSPEHLHFILLESHLIHQTCFLIYETFTVIFQKVRMLEGYDLGSVWSMCMGHPERPGPD